LKLIASPRPTEVGEVQRHRTLENARCNLVRMIKPNLIFSHDWHVQPNCQRSLRMIRLSGILLDRGPVCYTRLSSNLLRLPIRLTQHPRRFCANFLTLPNFHLPVNFNLFLRSRPLQHAVGGISSLAN